MKEKTKIDRMVKDYHTAKNKNEITREKYREMLEEANGKYETASVLYEKAIIGDDPSSFSSAKQELEKAKDAIHFYKMKLDQTESILDKDQAEENISNASKIVGDASRNAAILICGHLKNIDAILSELREVQDEVNSYCHEVSKDAKVKYLSTILDQFILNMEHTIHHTKQHYSQYWEKASN